MKDSKDYLNIDLDFLDKKEPIRVEPKSEPEAQKSSDASSSNEKKPREVTIDTKYSWKIILIIVGIILFFAWIIDSSTISSSTSSSLNTGGNTFTDKSGQIFSCSDHHYDQAVILKPNQIEYDILDRRIDANNTRSNEIEDIYVDQYDQESIDNYNEAVDDFNFRNNQLKTDLAAWDTKVDTYNNYLDNHCTPQ